MDFNAEPYWDDFEATNGALEKNYMRILFKPGYAIQARELTQAQTILQKQIERFGNSIFKNGSVVTGGQVFLQDVTYMNLDSQYVTTDILIADFDDKIVLSSDDTKRGQVLKTFNAVAIIMVLQKVLGYKESFEQKDSC